MTSKEGSYLNGVASMKSALSIHTIKPLSSWINRSAYHLGVALIPNSYAKLALVSDKQKIGNEYNLNSFRLRVLSCGLQASAKLKMDSTIEKGVLWVR